MSKSTPRIPDRSKYLLLRPRGARALSGAAIGGLYAWFILKFFVSDDRPWLQVAIGLLGLLGVVGSLVMFCCTYGFLANAPDSSLDERELQQRNAAYLRAYTYAVSMLLIGYIGTDLIGKVFASIEVSSSMIRNFLNLAFFTCLIMPAAILAWRDQPISEEN